MKKSLALAFCVISVLSGCSSGKKHYAKVSESASDVPVVSNVESTIASGVNDLSLHASSKIYFDYDNSDLSDASKSILDDWISNMLKSTDSKYILEGHADKRGTVEYNIGLGERRANSAKEYLINHGIDKERLTVISYGKECPDVLGDDEFALQQNRRVVIVPKS